MSLSVHSKGRGRRRPFMSWPQTSLEAVATARSHDDPPPPPRDFESIELSCDAVNSLIHFVMCCLFDLGFRLFGLLFHGLKPSSKLSRLLKATMLILLLWTRDFLLTEFWNADTKIKRNFNEFCTFAFVSLCSPFRYGEVFGQIELLVQTKFRQIIASCSEAHIVSCSEGHFLRILKPASRPPWSSSNQGFLIVAVD